MRYISLDLCIFKDREKEKQRDREREKETMTIRTIKFISDSTRLAESICVENRLIEICATSFVEYLDLCIARIRDIRAEDFVPFREHSASSSEGRIR